MSAENHGKVMHVSEGTETLWREFWSRGPTEPAERVRACVALAKPESNSLQFIVETGSGSHFQIDGGARNAGPTPVELVAAALAGNTASDVIAILRNQHQYVTRYQVRVEMEQAERPPRVFVAVRIHHIVTGQDIDAVAVSDAIAISEKKYCPVEAMLKHTAVITTTFEVVEEAAEVRKTTARATSSGS